jgi:hypothetical protein
MISTTVTNILNDGNLFCANAWFFAPAIIGQGTPKQQAVWLKKALNYDIITTYAQVRTYVVTNSELTYYLYITGSFSGVNNY